MMKKDIKRTYKSHRNKTLFDYKGKKARTIGVNHLTGIINHMNV